LSESHWRVFVSDGLATGSDTEASMNSVKMQNVFTTSASIIDLLPVPSQTIDFDPGLLILRLKVQSPHDVMLDK